MENESHRKPQRFSARNVEKLRRFLKKLGNQPTPQPDKRALEAQRLSVIKPSVRRKQGMMLGERSL